MENLVPGKELKKLVQEAKKHGPEKLEYCNRKNKKYKVILPDNKIIHFGYKLFEDYLIHKDSERREKFRKRASKIKNKEGNLTFEIKESPNYWSYELLW